MIFSYSSVFSALFISYIFSNQPAVLRDRAMTICMNTYGKHIPPSMRNNLKEVCECAAKKQSHHRPFPNSEDELIDQVHGHFMSCGGIDAAVFGTK